MYISNCHGNGTVHHQPCMIYPKILNKHRFPFKALNGTDRVHFDCFRIKDLYIPEHRDDFLQTLKCRQMSFAQDLAYVTTLVRRKPLLYLVTIVNRVNAYGVLLDLSAQMESLALNVPSRPRQAPDLAAV